MKFRELFEVKLKVDGVTLTGKITDKNKAEDLIRSFDWYSGAIDNGRQHREAESNNKMILNQLKELGVTNVDYPGYEMMGTKGRSFPLK